VRLPAWPKPTSIVIHNKNYHFKVGRRREDVSWFSFRSSAAARWKRQRSSGGGGGGNTSSAITAQINNLWHDLRHFNITLYNTYIKYTRHSRATAHTYIQKFSVLALFLSLRAMVKKRDAWFIFYWYWQQSLGLACVFTLQIWWGTQRDERRYSLNSTRQLFQLLAHQWSLK